MAVNSLSPGTKVAVGTSAVLVSAWSPNKEYTMLEADKANASTLYFGGTSAVTAAAGFGELSAGEVVTFPGPAAVYAISDGAAQNVRVVEGLK